MLMKILNILLLSVVLIISIFFSSCKEADEVLINTDPIVEPTQIFSKTYGSSVSDLVTGVCQANDGGIVVCGYTIASAFGDNDIYVTKLDDSGHVAWSNIYGGSGNDQATSIEKTGDGGYIITGQTSSFSGGFDPFTLKLDNAGNTQWSQYYRWWNQDYSNFVTQTSDGGYILTGYSNSFSIGEFDVYSIKIDASGGIMWARCYGGTGNEFGNSIRETADAGYIIGGYTFSFGNLGDGYVIKIYGDGGYNWSKTYGGSGLDNIKDLQRVSNGYIACGSTTSFGLIVADGYILNIDNQGFVYWSRTFGSNGAGESSLNSVKQISDGGYILGGSFQSSMMNAGDMCLLKLFGDGAFNDIATSVGVKTDGGYLLAGTTASFGAGSNDIFLQSLKPDGTGCLTDNPYTPSGGNPSTEVNPAATVYLSIDFYETIAAPWQRGSFSLLPNTQCIISPR
jgi:hypothetical protein